MSRTRGTHHDRRGPVGYVVLILAAVVTLIPFLYAISGSLRTTGQIAANPLGLPLPATFENYSTILGGDLFWRPLFNSIVIAVLTVAIMLITASLAAYPLARFQFRGREAVYAFITLGLLFPAAVAITPLYLLLRQLDLLNTPIGVALPQVAFGIPIGIVILRPFFQGIPRELEEAATLDGAGHIQFFLKVLIPMSVPALMTLGVLTFVGSWNGYLLPLLLLTSQENWTLPLGLAQFSGTYAFDTASILTYTVLSIIPTLLGYVVAERYLVQGLNSGALKG
ncbi:carbohydrate ABC transporter permease [Arthrobacter sp. MDT2-16]